jgi:hypothetical protein
MCAKCARNVLLQEEVTRYHAQTEFTALDTILTTLVEELMTKGKVTSVEAGLAMPRLELALLLLDTFVKYPLPTMEKATLPYNYCVLNRLQPWLSPLLRALGCR